MTSPPPRLKTLPLRSTPGLGKGQKKMVWDAIPIEALSGVCVEFVGAGQKHSIAVSDNGVIYTFGAGATGKCPLPLYLLVCICLDSYHISGRLAEGQHCTRCSTTVRGQRCLKAPSCRRWAQPHSSPSFEASHAGGGWQTKFFF